MNRPIAAGMIAAPVLCGLAAAAQREQLAVPRGILETLWVSRVGVASLTPQELRSFR